MYYSGQYTDPTGSVEVDRALGKSYDVVKAVYNQLGFIETYANSYTELEKYDTTLKTLNEALASYSAENATGVFIGHDQGRVGVDPERVTFSGENFISALTRNWDNLNLVADNIINVTDLANHLNSIKALAYITTEVTTVASNVDIIKNIYNNQDQLTRIYLNLKELYTIYGSLDTISSVNKYLNIFQTIIENIHDITHIHDYLHTLESVNANISVYEKANLNLKTYLEILEFRFEVINVSNNINYIKEASSIVNTQQELVSSFNNLLEIKEDISKLSTNMITLNILAKNLDALLYTTNSVPQILDIHNNLEELINLNNSLDDIKSVIDSSNNNIQENTENINAISLKIEEASLFISTFLSNLPSGALLTGQDNRINTLIGSIKETNIDSLERSYTAPANGWFVNYYYGKATTTEDVEPSIQEVLTMNDRSVTIKIKKPNGSFDDNMQLYVVKDSVLTIKASNLDSLSGKIQFIKEG